MEVHQLFLLPLLLRPDDGVDNADIAGELPLTTLPGILLLLLRRRSNSEATVS